MVAILDKSISQKCQGNILYKLTIERGVTIDGGHVTCLVHVKITQYDWTEEMTE